MAKPSAATFVVGYSVVLLVLFVTFSVLMSNVNPDRIFFDNEMSTAPSVASKESLAANATEVPHTTGSEKELHHRRSHSDDNITQHMKYKKIYGLLPKMNLVKERRSLRDPSSVLDKLGIVVLEVLDEEGKPRIEIMFHPKRSLLKKRKKNRGENNSNKSFSAYGKGKTHKGLVTELTDNSVIKIMADNTVVFENSDILTSEESAALNSIADVTSTNVEIDMFPTEALDFTNSTIASGNDKRPREIVTSQVDGTIELIGKKQFEEIKTIETTTDETSERSTNIDDLFVSVDIKSSIASYLPETINLDAYGSKTTNISEKYNNIEMTDAVNFDVKNTIDTKLIRELDISSLAQRIHKPTRKDNYATETANGEAFEVINSNNTTTEIEEYEISGTTVLTNSVNIDISDATNLEMNNKIKLSLDTDT